MGASFIKQHQHFTALFCRSFEYIALFTRAIAQQNHVQIKSVHNLTGTVLHTNLGRALWAESAQQAALHAMKGNVALEYDLEEGKR